jgi:hypothetical protein
MRRRSHTLFFSKLCGSLNEAVPSRSVPYSRTIGCLPGRCHDSITDFSSDWVRVTMMAEETIWSSQRLFLFKHIAGHLFETGKPLSTDAIIFHGWEVVHIILFHSQSIFLEPTAAKKKPSIKSNFSFPKKFRKRHLEAKSSAKRVYTRHTLPPRIIHNHNPSDPIRSKTVDKKTYPPPWSLLLRDVVTSPSSLPCPRLLLVF